MTTPTTTDESRPPATTASRKPWTWLGAAAAAAVLVGGTFVVLDGDDATGPPMELSLGADDSLASCLPLEATTLATMSPAFAATATNVEGETVVLEVDRWYAGGDADTVELHAQPGMQALIAGFDFEVGEQYLITAAEGTVNFCGYSGPATPELTAVFDEAFAAG